MDNSNQPFSDQQMPTQTPVVNNSGGPKIIYLVLAGAIVTLIAICSYILGTKQNQTFVSNQQNTTVPTIISTPTPINQTANPDSIGANWKTYTSDRCGFSINYPTNWNAQSFFIQDSANTCGYITAPDYQQGLDSREGFYINLTRTKKGSKSTFNNIIINTIDDFIRADENSVQSPGKALNIENKNIGQLEGKQYDLGFFEDFSNFIFMNGDYIYKVSWPSQRQYSGKYSIAIDQILSTFQFSD